MGLGRVLVTLACFAVGVALGAGPWGAHEGVSARPEASATEGAAPRAPVPRPKPVPVAGRSGTAPSATSAASAHSVAPSTATALAELQAAIDALRPRAGPPGTGVIEGDLRAIDGRPLAGVEVRLQGDDEGRPRDDIEDPLDPALSMAARIRRHVDGPLGSGAAPRVARTDAAGAFAFAGIAEDLLDDRALTLEVLVPDHEVRLRTDLRTEPPFPLDGDRLSLVAFPVGEARFRVTLPDGAPAEGHLEIDVRPRPSNAARELDEGRLRRLEPGRYEARASREAGPRRLRSEWAPFEVEVGRLVDVPLPLASRPGVIARVIVPAAIPLGAEPRARLLRLEAGPLPTPEEVARRGVAPDRRRVWSDGTEEDFGARRFGSSRPADAPPPVLSRTFEFLDREPGRYALVACWSGVAGGPARPVTIEGETVEVDLPLSALEEAPLVHVRALGPDGAPIQAMWTGGGIERRSYGTEVRLPPPEGLAPGASWLLVEARDLGTRPVPVPAPGARAVDVRFEAPGALRVRVVGSGGPSGTDGPCHALLHARSDVGVVSPERILAVQLTGGEVLLEHLQPGGYEVAVERRMQDVAFRVPLGRAAVRVVTGAQAEAVIEAALVHEVRVTTASPCRVSLRPVPDPDGFRWRVDLAPGADARPRLAEGEWEIEWEVDAREAPGPAVGLLVGRRRFRVPETTSIALEGP